MTKRADILSLLKEEKQFLERQLKKVQIAIAAFTEDDPASKPVRKRGPKSGKKTVSGKKRGRKPKNAVADDQHAEPASETMGSPELG